jgi:integrase
VALKEVAGLAGLNIPLTMHVARHCWASVAKSKNIPLSVIREGMGHDSEETTRIYLASLDTSVVDKANSLILKIFDRIFMVKCVERKDESLDKRAIPKE